MVEQTVSEVMGEYKSIDITSTVAKIIPLIDEKGMFVFDDGRFVGVVAPWIPSSRFDTTEMTIKNLVHKVPKVGPDSSVSEAARLLRAAGVPSLPVFDGDKLVGAFTIYHALSVIEDVFVASRSSITSESPISQAVEIMQKERVSHVPVINDDNFVGVISALSLLRNYFSRFDDEKPRSKEVRSEKVDLLTLPAKNFLATMPSLNETKSVVQVMIDEQVTAVYTPLGIVTAMNLLPAKEETNKLDVELKGWSDLRLDGVVRARAQNIIDRALESLATIAPNDAKLVLHFKEYSSEGERQKYSINARLEHPGKPFVVDSISDWDLTAVLHQVINAFEVQLKKA